MQLDKLLRDSETESQSTMSAVEPRISLTERFEHVGQELNGDSGAIVADDDFHIRPFAAQRARRLGPSDCEFDRVGQQIPKDLLQARGVAQDGPCEGIEIHVQHNPFRISCRFHTLDSLPETVPPGSAPDPTGPFPS